MVWTEGKDDAGFCGVFVVVVEGHEWGFGAVELGDLRGGDLADGLLGLVPAFY